MTAVAVAAGTVALAIYGDLGAGLEERTGLNALFAMRGTIAPPRDVHVVDVSLSAFSRQGIARRSLPGCDAAVRINRDILSRCELAELITALAAHKPSVIVLDIAFEQPTAPDADAALAQAMKKAGNVILLKRAHSVLDPQAGVLREQLLPLQPELAAAALGAAPFPIPKRPEQLTRFWVFHQPFGNHPTLPALAYYAFARNQMEMARPSVPLEQEFMAFCRQAHAAAPPAAAPPAPVSSRFCGAHSKVINFYGPPATIALLDPFKIIANRLPLPADGVFFLGDAGHHTYQQADAFRTVFSDVRGFDVSGVEIAATAFLNLREGNALVAVPGLQWPLAVIFAIFTYVVCRALKHAVLRFAALFALIGAGCGLGYYAFASFHFWLPIFIPACAALLALALVYLLDNQKLSERLSVLHAAVRNYILPWQEGDYFKRLSPGEQHRAIYGICIKFDFEDYSLLAARLSDAELAALMNANFEWAIGEVSRSGGQTVSPGDDSFLAYWELNPQAAPPLARYALSCAAKISAGNPAHTSSDPARLRLRAGISLGTFAIGNVGGHGRYAVNLTGQVVNQAARIEQLNRMLKSRLLCSEEVAALISPEQRRYVGRFSLKGIPQSLAVYEIHIDDETGEKSHRARDEDFQTALKAYEDGRYSEAATAFMRLCTDFPDDGPAEYYCNSLTANANRPQHLRGQRGNERARDLAP
jgi:adenylate cyclase